MKVLVTGAAGRLGSCVCRLLTEAKIEFLAVDKYPDPQAAYPVEVIDLLDGEACSELLEGVDVLVHFANHANWKSDASEMIYSENGTMNMNLFQAAANAGCGRIVFSSSIQVFNGQLPIDDRAAHEIVLPYIPIDSDMPAFPRNAYSLSKQVAENLLKYFSDTKAMTCIVIRYPLLLDSKLLRRAREAGGIERGNCYDGFAYLPIYSAAEAAVKAMSVDLDGYRQYFVASKDNLEQRQAREVIEGQLSGLHRKKPIAEMDSLVDCTKVETELGWKQPQSLEESFAKYSEYKAVLPY
jgi:nucleoside-diphosphate-sugar epimerase|tara:strand:+ start:575 stop:1462 length:888 start_codon:yes stop_codon:yes gene_type:complete